VAYEGRIPHKKLVAIIREECEQSHMHCEIVPDSDSHTIIRATQKLSFVKSFLKTLPQRLYVEISSQGLESTFKVDADMFSRYKAFLLALWTTNFLLLAFVLTSFPSAGPNDLLVFAGCLFLFINYDLLTTLNKSTLRWRKKIEVRLNDCRYAVSRISVGVVTKFVAWSLAYVACALLLVIRFLFVVLARSNQATPSLPASNAINFWGILLLGLLLCIAVLIATIVVILKSRGFGERIVSTLLGLSVGVAIMMSYASMLPWVMATVLPEKSIVNISAFRHSAENGFTDINHDDRQKAEQSLKQVKVFAWGLVVGQLFLLTVGIYLAYSVLPLSRRVLQSFSDFALRGKRSIGWYAFHGLPVRTALGLIVLPLWVLFTLTTWTVFYISILSFLGALGVMIRGLDPIGLQRGIVFSREMSFFLGSNALGLAVRLFVEAMWFIYPLPILALLMASVASHIRIERTKFKRLMGNILTPNADTCNLLPIIAEVAAKARISTPLISISDSLKVGAVSHRFFLRRRSFIEIPSNALECLSQAELCAMISHEMIHLKRHSLLMCVARIVSRLSLLGADFLPGLLNSYRFEFLADRLAIERLQANEGAMIRCIMKCADISPLSEEPNSVMASALAMAGETKTLRLDALNKLDSLRFAMRIKAYLRLFRSIYFGTAEPFYWHPLADERIQEIKRRFAQPMD